jgi:hypothetical protein
LSPAVVAERVVDRLEAVDVDDHHRSPAAVAGAEGDVLVELGAEATAVEKAGERVVVGEVAQLRLGSLGSLERRQHDLAVLVLELLQHGFNRRLALSRKSFGSHSGKVVLSRSQCRNGRLPTRPFRDPAPE